MEVTITSLNRPTNTLWTLLVPCFSNNHNIANGILPIDLSLSDLEGFAPQVNHCRLLICALYQSVCYRDVTKDDSLHNRRQQQVANKSPPTVYRLSVNCWLMLYFRIRLNCWPSVRQLSVVCWPFIGQCWPPNQPTVYYSQPTGYWRAVLHFYH